jgi:hypothetical protein
MTAWDDRYMEGFNVGLEVGLAGAEKIDGDGLEVAFNLGREWERTRGVSSASSESSERTYEEGYRKGMVAGASYEQVRWSVPHSAPTVRHRAVRLVWSAPRQRPRRGGAA